MGRAASESLTRFRRNSAAIANELNRSSKPLVLTRKGKPSLVVQDAEAYQKLLDLAAKNDVNEGIRQGLEDARKGRLRSAEEFFEEFEAEHGLPH